MWQWLKALFEAWNSANKVAEKALPSEKIQEEKFEISKQTLEVETAQKRMNKLNKIADEMFGDLRRHPEISISDKVRYEGGSLSFEEQDLLIKILTDRLNADKIYLKLKNKKGKFDYSKK